MTKYEPNFFVPCDKLRDAALSPALCKDEPLKAGDAVANFINEFLSQEQKDIVILEKNKAKILPGKLQEKVKIAALSNGTLILKANSSVWSAEIAAIKTNIATACNDILGKIAVKTVRVG
jgi:hypothetical protein